MGTGKTVGQTYLDVDSLDESIIALLREESKTNPFVNSVRSFLDKTGYITERQFAALKRVKKNKDNGHVSETRPVRDVSLDRVIDDGPYKNIAETFANADSEGGKALSLRADGVTLKAAPPNGRNPDWVYVFDHFDCYAGKISPSGHFKRSGGAASDERDFINDLDTVNTDPRKAAIAYGSRTGVCSCCGRTLTDHKSIEAGIGPICADKWGF